MDKYKCFFCDTQITVIGKYELHNGWDIITGEIGDEPIHLIHCPKHEDKSHHYIHSLILKAGKCNLHYKSMSISNRSLTLSDIPHLVLWRKLACLLMGHKITTDSHNINSCSRCEVAYTSFVLGEDK